MVPCAQVEDARKVKSIRKEHRLPAVASIGFVIHYESAAVEKPCSLSGGLLPTLFTQTCAKLCSALANSLLMFLKGCWGNHWHQAGCETPSPPGCYLLFGYFVIYSHFSLFSLLLFQFSCFCQACCWAWVAFPGSEMLCPGSPKHS